MKKEKGLISVLMLPIIATLILGVGIYVYSSSYSAISDTAGQMRDMENDLYNSMINMYIGDSQKGSDVKKMIDNVIAQNAQYVNERGKFISIHVDKIDEYDDYTLEKVTRAANIYENFNAETSEANRSAAQVEYINLKQKIKTAKNYTVTETKKDGIIYAVTISQND